MSDILAVDDAVADQLRALEAAAASTVCVRPDLAATVLDRACRQRRTRRLRRATIATVSGLALLGSVAAATQLGRSDFYTVTEPSAAMRPTIQADERVVFDKKLAPQRGDVVIAHLNDDGGYDLIARVVGLPGDTVGCPAGPTGRCDALTVNGAPVSEPYLGGSVTGPFPTSTVPTGRVFLLGDNRGEANDSRYLGSVRLTAVGGVATGIGDAGGRTHAVPGAPAHPGPGDRDDVDPVGPLPPAHAMPPRQHW
jgi:signal peptidase I